MQDAHNALKYYKGYEGKTELERNAFNKEFERLQALAKERKEDKNVHLSDFRECSFLSFPIICRNLIQIFHVFFFS